MTDHLTNVSNALAAVEEYFDVLTKKPVDELTSALPPIDKAKVQVGLAYSINALLYVLLKTQGVSSKDARQTQVKQELDRVKGYIQKIKYSEEMAKGRKARIDAEAAGRFIHHALSSDQVYAEAAAARAEDNAAKKEEEAAEEKKEKETKSSKKKHKAETKAKGPNKRARK